MTENGKRKNGKSIIIIGGGIAGLCAGSYARMNDYDVKIFEMHNLPGGVCTAWKRSGYMIDSCIHSLVGSAPGVNYHQLWKEVGALEGSTMVDLDEYMSVEGEDGRALILYTNVDRLEQLLLELAPEGSGIILSLARAIESSRGSTYLSARRPICTRGKINWARCGPCDR